MKAGIKLLLLSAVLLVCVAMKVNRLIKVEEERVTLADAFKNKIITGDFKGGGSYSGMCMNLMLKNEGNKKITVTIPAGTMFKPSDEGAQNILVPEEQVFVLQPKETKLNKVRGFCCEATDRAPAKDMLFSLAKNNDPKMMQLYAAVKGKRYPDNVLQEAVWCISNNHSVADIYAPKMEAIKPLRDELCKITGQKDTWYSTPKNHTVDASGNISHVTTSVTGLVKFKALTASKVHNEIHGADGKLILKNPNEFTVIPGNVEYDFEIRVEGWQKGTYYVMVYEDAKVIHKQEFKI